MGRYDERETFEMPETRTPATAPGKTVPYILRAGDGRCLNVAGQVMRLVAGTEETAGGFGAVVCEATQDRQPIPLHYHAKEHDTWFCTRGRLRVWYDDVSRLLTAGDFAYVKPGDIHSYQSVAPRTQFFGVVAPGGWEGFFKEAGEDWLRPGLPPENHPFDFSRMGPSMGKYGVIRADHAKFAELTNGDQSDRSLPEAPSSYVLQSGHGVRSRLNGHLSTTVLSRAVSRGQLDMRTVEAGRRALMPAVRHDGTHVMVYVLDGVLQLTLDGNEYVLGTGDCANIPAGVAYGSEVRSGHARWLLTGSSGDGLTFWDTLGTATREFTFADDRDIHACTTALGSGTCRDVALAGIK
jgi:quercetin dioxygenase-like cupin family protein